ncbi:helix-turn-helix transcriptional regulator [Ligaoa zhengdingensis]|uniref:helix-turn-helix domain-containing protein n=1 Tax=Ligaoa zhengdingensis TaxID=2763658 RepID=UPI0031BB8774
MLKERFGKNLKHQREQRKLTQEMAAELCDLSSRYWGKIERGDAAASIDTIEKVSIRMNISVEELLKEDVLDESDKSVQ